MKNLVNKIQFDEEVKEVVLPNSPMEVEGFLDLEVEEQNFCSTLPRDWWVDFVADTLRAKAMDLALAKALEA